MSGLALELVVGVCAVLGGLLGIWRELSKNRKDNRTVTGSIASTGGRIFISHSYSDGSAIANQLASELEASGNQCWMGQRDMRTGEDFPAQIVAAIRECRVLVVLITDGARASRDVLQEVSLGHNANKPMVPLIIRDARPSDSLTYYLGVVQQVAWTDARSAAATVRAVLARTVPR